MVRQGSRCKTWMTVLLAAGTCLLGGRISIAGAADKETRLFSIRIDGRQAGRYQMTITIQDEHTALVTGQADVALSYFIKKYTYSYQGTEVWKDGRLVHLESRTNDDGTRYQVLAEADGETLWVRVNGKESMRPRSDTWTTTYWRLPEPRFRKPAVVLIDCDTGKELHANLQNVGIQSVTAAGQVQTGTHYRLRGEVTVDLWYDGQERLIHEEYTEDGHRIVFDLLRIER
jgi:hypothetical protein